MKVESAVNLACIFEATAAKPGNVNRGNDFHDTSLVDFLVSAAAITPVFLRAAEKPTSLLVLESVEATRKVTSVNTNLGIILLLAPLAKSFLRNKESILDSPSEFQTALIQWQAGMIALLKDLDPQQADRICDAIALANPGGLGSKREGDVNQGSGGRTVLQLMKLAEKDDTIALQYTTGFQIIFQDVAPTIQLFLVNGFPLQIAIIATHLLTLSKYPDSLIARKNGSHLANSISVRATKICQQWLSQPFHSYDQFAETQEEFWKEVKEFDFFLRSDENRRNPGTTADLIAAGLFVLLCLDQIPQPLNW